MKFVCVLVAALFLVPTAQAGGFRLDGYHASPLMGGWAAESKMPLPQTKIWVGFGDPMSPWGSSTIYLPSCCTGGWTHLAIRGLLFHELGHVFDRTNMTPELRAQFRELVGVPEIVNWWLPIKTVRWVVSSNYFISIPLGEMFAEEYAACSLGMTQLQYQDAGYNSYGWVPPQGTDEAAICNLILEAGRM